MIREMRTMNDAVIVVSRQASRLAELWAERDHLHPPVHSVADRPEPRALIFVQGLLDEGWTLRGITPRDEGERRSVGLWSLHVVTDAEIFGWSHPQPRRRGKPKAITPEQFFADLCRFLGVSPGFVPRSLHQRGLEVPEVLARYAFAPGVCKGFERVFAFLY